MKLTLKPLIAIAVILVTALSSCQKTPVDYSKDINDLKALVSELQQRSDSLAIALGNTNTNLSNLSKSVDSIKVKLTDIQTQIDALTLSLTTANANIAAINAQLILLNQQYASLLEQLNAILALLNAAPPTLSDGLVAYYPFTGNAGDSSGNGNHGTVYGASLTAGKLGISNSAYLFNGIDNRIDLPNPFLLGTQNSVFSFSTRIKFNDISNVPNIWGKTLFWGEVNFQINPDSSVHFWWANSFSGNKYSSIITNPGVMHTNVWHDLVVVFENSLGTIYIDGNLVLTNSSWSAQGGGLLSSTQTETVCNFAQDANSSRFGARTASGSLQGFLKGAIDDFRIYNRSLTQSEITYLATH